MSERSIYTDTDQWLFTQRLTSKTQKLPLREFLFLYELYGTLWIHWLYNRNGKLHGFSSKHGTAIYSIHISSSSQAPFIRTEEAMLSQAPGESFTHESLVPTGGQEILQEMMIALSKK